MLDLRAEYEDAKSVEQIVLKQRGLRHFPGAPIPIRTRAKVATIRIHRGEIANHDYFWGGWVSTVVEQDQWMLTRPGEIPFAPGAVDVTGTVPSKRKFHRMYGRPKIKADLPQPAPTPTPAAPVSH